MPVERICSIVGITLAACLSAPAVRSSKNGTGLVDVAVHRFGDRPAVWRDMETLLGNPGLGPLQSSCIRWLIMARSLSAWGQINLPVMIVGAGRPVASPSRQPRTSQPFPP